MPRSAESDLGLHSLPVTLLDVSRLQWVNWCPYLQLWTYQNAILRKDFIIIIIIIIINRAALFETCLWANADSEGPDQSAHQGLHCPLTESLDTTEYMIGEQRPG